MRKLLFAATLFSAFELIGFGSAFAGGGGMGDPSVHMRDQNALCDLQRLGRAPAYPSVCLPDDPTDPAAHGHDLSHPEY